MTVWEDLVSVALVGVERRPFPLARVGEAVADAPALEVAGAEAQALAAAAVLAAYRRAGRRPDRPTAAPPAPAEPDHRPTCSERAAQLLALLLEGAVTASGGNDELIAAWLGGCTGAGRRPPDDMIVPLLTLGDGKPWLRPAVAAACGPRGAWLGQANPAWAWAAGVVAEDESADYQTAPRADRVAILLRLRARDPAAGRELLRSTWKAEPAAERAALLAALQTALSDADEPFLEDVLDDRAATVRAEAVRLLDQLPTSRRAARMAERALGLVRLKGTFRRRLEVELPEEMNDGARRDGIGNARSTGRGRRQEWLTRIVAATPLSAWDALGAEPEDLVRLAVGETSLLAGWEEAATRQRDPRWVRALLGRTSDAALIAALSPGEAAACVTHLLRSRAVPLEVVAAVPAPWTADYSRTALGWLMGQNAGFVVAEKLAMRLHPVALPLVNTWIEKAPEEPVRRQLRKLAHTLSIRTTIAEEFS